MPDSGDPTGRVPPEKKDEQYAGGKSIAGHEPTGLDEPETALDRSADNLLGRRASSSSLAGVWATIMRGGPSDRTKGIAGLPE
jgi:hypothetical protein